MKLFSVKFSGYKRFLESTTLKINGKMTVLIGPNEAGKSSTLKMLAHLSNEDAFSPHEKYKYQEDVEANISAEFYLEDDDHDAIGSSIPIKYVLQKQDDGELIHNIEPKIMRPHSHRGSFEKVLSRCLESKYFSKANQLDDSSWEKLKLDVKNIDFDNENIPENNMSVLLQISSIIEHSEIPNAPKYISEMPKKIYEFMEIEKRGHPNTIALNTIINRLPKVLEFTEKDRELAPTYNMTLFKHADASQRREPCAALTNLCKVAGFDLALLKKNFDENKPDRITKQFSNANIQLEKLFESIWTQSDISIHLSWHKPNIQIMVQQKDEGDLEYNMIDERSDGFRQYVALLAFIIKEDAQKPILLIDEAELHLHYDAQADLIQTFTSRNLTSQVIYTTHSAGCLPEDLGVGVKLVVPVENGENFATSKIENNFWSTDTLGFSPVLYGMGAKTLAFFPTRRAVVTEGQTEMLLMPTLFRQVSGADFNGFQIVPGLANASNEDLPLLALQGQKVSYLVDNDDAGKIYCKKLEKLGVLKGQIFKVCSSGKMIITVEDWINDECFTNAVETYRTRHFNEKKKFENEFFYGDGKAKKLDQYQKEIGVVFSKVHLAYIILETIHNDPNRTFFNPKHKKHINDLRSNIIASFD